MAGARGLIWAHIWGGPGDPRNQKQVSCSWPPCRPPRGPMALFSLLHLQGSNVAGTREPSWLRDKWGVRWPRVTNKDNTEQRAGR